MFILVHEINFVIFQLLNSRRGAGLNLFFLSFSLPGEILRRKRRLKGFMFIPAKDNILHVKPDIHPRFLVVKK